MTGWWEQVRASVLEDLSDLPDAGQIARVVVRLGLAAVLGGLLGFERGQHGKAAGMRTHMLVALGAAFFVLTSQQVGMPTADMSRVVQGVVTGIGFIGAGAILKLSEQGQVRGLTTAASIWMAAAIGMAAGLGREMVAILGALLTLTVLAILPRIARPFDPRSPQIVPGSSVAPQGVDPAPAVRMTNEEESCQPKVRSNSQ